MNNIEYGKIYARYLIHKIANYLYPEKPLRIKRAKKYGIIKKIDPEVRCRECDITPCLIPEEYNDIVKRFIKAFEENLPHCSKLFYYNKIKSLKIEEHRKVLEDKPEQIDFIIQGIHNTMRDDINIYIYSEIDEPKENLHKIKIEKEDTTTHELVHFASSIKKGVVLFSGFSQTIKDEYSYCYGLNEGYTEILNLRYFSNKKQNTTYSEQQLIALGIEEIVGKEKMESLYFEANLEGLVEELGKYTTREHIISLLDKIDLCHNSESDKEKYNSLGREIRTEIANIQITKNKKLLAERKITQEEFEDRQLKTAFYVRSHILDKSKEGYTFKQHNEPEARYLPTEGYRILKNHFLSTNELNHSYTPEDCQFKKDDIVAYSYLIRNLATNGSTDLSQVETINIYVEDRTLYEIIPKEKDKDESKIDEQDQTELNTMLKQQSNQTDNNNPKKVTN